MSSESISFFDCYLKSHLNLYSDSHGQILHKADVRRKVHVHLIANNNRVIISSQTYASIANVKIGIESVRTNCAAPVENQTVEGYEVLKHPKYEVYLDVGGKPRFRLKALNGEIIAVSQAYADKSSCIKGIASIGSHAPNAEIVIEESE